jgi:diaminohydroxyphosphoribosylaminopyrimidine deaminase/5-amino-6-(5-phosphoribosylamino)uracil reductase
LYLHIAELLSYRTIGQTWPNPAVGCVIVRGNQIIGRGWTQKGGRPHAEVMALQDAGEAARGAVAYVTLEPCCHHGKTPPCTDALIKAGIKKVVFAAVDPNPKVAGKGIAALQKAGIEVELIPPPSGEVRRGLGSLLCQGHYPPHTPPKGRGNLEGNRGFFKLVVEGKPLVTLKMATSHDGKITNDKQRWITGERARQHGHLLRAQHDAIMVGSNTILIDDPMLNCRLHGMQDRSPVRVILDRRLRVSENSKIVQTAKEYRTIIFTEKSNLKSAKKLEKAGVEIMGIESADNAESLDGVLFSLGVGHSGGRVDQPF